VRTLDDEFSALREHYREALLTPTEGLHLINIPNFPLPSGWSQTSTEVRFVVPNGYPYAAPDSFWSSGTLRLPNEGMPQNTQLGYVAPGQPQGDLLWFSWHLQQPWNPSTCTLLTYVKVIQRRFEERR
jgi:hypothetical protein